IQGGQADRGAGRGRQSAAARRSLEKRGSRLVVRPSYSIDPIDGDRRGGSIRDDHVILLPSGPVDAGDMPAPSRQSLRGLDWFIFFLADVQTGFGPFIAVYLTTEKWTQAQIGFVLSIAGVVGLIGQMPGGAII